MACSGSTGGMVAPVPRAVGAVRAVWVVPIRLAATFATAWLLSLAAALVGCAPAATPVGTTPLPTTPDRWANLASKPASATRPTSTPAPGAAATAPAIGDPAWVEAVAAECAVPAGWRADPLEHRSPGSATQTWVSPSGATAYGVIVVRHFLMPLAGDRLILGEFLKEMNASEGAAELLDERPDPKLAGGIGGIRFVAKGGRYTVRGALVSSGARAWVVFAGTLVAESVRPDELSLAERARDRTIIEPARDRPR